MADTTSKPRRVTIDLPPAANKEVQHLKSITGLTTADLFRSAMVLLGIYVRERERGHQLHVVDPNGEQVTKEIILTIPFDNVPQPGRTERLP